MKDLFLVLMVLLGCSSVALARTWYVRPDGTGDVPTIAVAVDSAAAEGDTVLLADGTFAGEGNREVDCLDKALTIISETGNPGLCIIDCGCCGEACFERCVGFYFRASEHGTPRLEGVTITGACGGVICDTSSCPEIVDCIFQDNICRAAEIGYTGAGMYCLDNSEPVINDCTFLDNDAWVGGGLDCQNSSPTLIGVSFMSNGACMGGGMYTHGGAATLTGCTFDGNVTGCPMSGSGGGGFFCGGSAELVDCSFRDNWCSNGFGAGLCYSPVSGSDHLEMHGCSIVGNRIEDLPGAGMAVLSPSEYDLNVTLDNCTFAQNGSWLGSSNAACLYIEGNATVVLENTVIAFTSDGEAIHCESPKAPTLTCCDIYENAGGDWEGCIADQYEINGNFSADPKFCDILSGDFQVEDCSPCLPGYHPDGYDCGGIIGTYGAGCACGAATEPTTWGAIKSMYR